MNIRKIPHLLIEFTPETDIDFRPLKVTVPPLNNLDVEAGFKELIDEVVKRSCGQLACEGNVGLWFSPLTDSTVFPRTLLSSCIQCSAIDCPLDKGGYAGDREPVSPVGPKLAQYIEIDVPK